MDFGEFMASWEPITEANDNHEAQPITNVPLSPHLARNEADNSHQTWLEPSKFSGTIVRSSDSKLLDNQRGFLKPNFINRVTSSEIGYSHDMPKENTNPDEASATIDCTRKLKRKVMVLPPSESYRGFCIVDDIPNVERRPWENLSPAKGHKAKKRMEVASSQASSKQVKVMRLVSPERNALPVGGKNRKICTLQSSPVRDVNVKMIKPSPTKILEPPSNQNKPRNDISTKSTVISGSSKDNTQRKSLESRKKVMKISSSDNRRHEDIDDHFNKLLKEAKSINNQMETLKKSTFNCREACDNDGETKEDHQSKPKVVKILRNSFSSPQKAARKTTEREKDDATVDKKSEVTKKYDRQAALSYMKQKKALMKEKQAREVDRKRCEEESRQQKLQELHATRLKLLKNALKKKDVTQDRRNWEGPVDGESSPPPPLPVHRSSSDVRIKHISRQPSAEQCSTRKSETSRQHLENIEIGPSFVTVNGENCMNSSRKSFTIKEYIEAGPSFVVANAENCSNPSSKSKSIKRPVENIEIAPSFVAFNGENCMLDLKEVRLQNEAISCGDDVPLRGPVAIPKESIGDQNGGVVPRIVRSREILGFSTDVQIEGNLEVNPNSSSFVPFYEDEMREITDQINQIGAALKNITERKVVEKRGDKNRSRNRADEDVWKKCDDGIGGNVSNRKVELPVDNRGSWCELLRSKDHSLREGKKHYEEENESSDQPHTTTQDESISGGPINELTDEENLYQPLTNERSSTQQQYNTSLKPTKEESTVPDYIKALDHAPNPLNFITVYKSKLDMLKQQNNRNRVEGNKLAVEKNLSRSSTKSESCNRSEFKENLTLKDLETCPEDGLSSRRSHSRNLQDRVYALTDDSSDLVSRQNGFQPLLLDDLKLHFPRSLKSDTTSGKNSTASDCCESEDIVVVNGTNNGNTVDDRLFKANSDSQLEKCKQRLFVSDSVRSLTLCHSLATLENKKEINARSGNSGGGSSLSLSAPDDCVRVGGSTVCRESAGDKVGSTVGRESDRFANNDAAEFVEPKRVSRERSHVRPGKATLPSGTRSEADGVLEIGNVFSPAAIHLQFQAELSKLDAYEVGLQQLTDSERLHNMALKSLHNQTQYETLNKSSSIDKFGGKSKIQLSAIDKHSDVDEPIVLTSSHHSQSSSSSSLSSSSNPTNHRDSRHKESQSLTSSVKTIADISLSGSGLKQVDETSGNLVKPNDRLFDETPNLGRSFEKVESLAVPDLQQPNFGLTQNLPSEGQQHSSILEQTIATLVSNPGAQVLDSLLNESNGFENLMSSAHASTPLFDEQSSSGSPFPSSCSNSIFDKCITYEEARSDHQLNVYKSKEKELINRVKVQVSWLEFQKKRMKQKGLEEEAKNIKKKQRGLILKSQQIREEIHRLMKAEKMASEERRKLLHQQKLRAMHQLSVKDSAKKRKTNEVILKKSLQSQSSSTTSIAESLLSGEEASIFSEPKSLQIVEEQKRHLSERKKIAIGRNRNSDVLSPNKKRFEEKDLNLDEVEHRNIKSPKHTVGRSVLDRSTSPFPVSIESEKVETADTAKSHLQADPTDDSHAETDNVNSVPEELAKSNQSDSVDSQVTEELPESTLEQPSFTIHSRQPTPLKTRTDDQSGSKSSQTKTASERRTTLSSMMIPIKVPLSPRLQGCTRKRYSSGSEDSITFSQNETFSEQSDIEIRLSALHEQLRQRKLEADRLRREQKRAQRERLKCKEQALLKQIQAYDAYIEQVKKELEQEIESPSTVPIMRPQIKQPRFVDKASLRKPETLKPELEKKTTITSDEELSSLKSISEASSLETTIQSPGQRDSSVDEQQISEKISSSAASSPPHSGEISKILPPEVSSSSPLNSGKFSKILVSKIENSVPEVSSASSPTHSGVVSENLEAEMGGNVPEVLENSSDVSVKEDNATEKWVAAAEFFKNKFSIDSPLNKSAERVRKTNHYSATVDDDKVPNSCPPFEDNDGEFSEKKNVEIMSSIASSYSEKSNGDETLSEVEEILKESSGNSVESVLESEKNSVESIVEQIETKSEDGSGLAEVNTENNVSEKSLDKQEDIDKISNKQNDILVENSSIESSVDDILNEVGSSKSPASTHNVDKSSVIVEIEVITDESSDKESIKTAQSALDADEPSALVGSALNRSSYSSKSVALELNPYDSSDDTFESDVDASENESSVPESKHSSNLSIPDLFPLPVAGAEGHRSLGEGHRSAKGHKNAGEGRSSPEGHKSEELLLSDVGKSLLVEKSLDIPDSTNHIAVDVSESLIHEETSPPDLEDIKIRNKTSVADFEDKLIREETSVANLEDKLIREETFVADFEDKLIREETSVANLEDELIDKETSEGNLEDNLIRNVTSVADETLEAEDVLEVSEEDVLSEVSEALSYNRGEESEHLSPGTKSCSSSSESSEFTVQKKAKVVSLNSTDSSEKSNQDYDTSFKEDEVIKVILVEKEKMVTGGGGDDDNQDFVQVREEGRVEEEEERVEEGGKEEKVEDLEEEEEREDVVLKLGGNDVKNNIENKESKIDRITDNILLNLLNESLTFSPKVSSSNKELLHEDNCVINEQIMNGGEEQFSFNENDDDGADAEDIQTTAPFITALRKENEREKRKSLESVTDKVLEEFIRDATDSVLRIYGRKTGGKLLHGEKTEAVPSTGTATSPTPGSLPDFNSPSKDSSFDSNDGSWLKDEAENELEVSGGETEAFWLEEEMGLEHSCKEARELQLQRLQIEQEIKQLQQVQEQIPSYFYFREIPNKPPPPYTPPGQARAKIANDRIPTKQQEILAIVNSLTDYLYTQHSLGKDINALTPPRNLITRADSSQGIYKRFLFDLTKQIVIEAKYRHEEEDAEQRLPWQQIDYKQKCVAARSLEELKAVVARRVKVLYGFEPQVARENLIVQWSKKHNKIDKFLVNELQEEECQWTDFSKQELMLKNKVTDDLVDQLVGETASVLDRALARKVERLSRVCVDDT